MRDISRIPRMIERLERLWIGLPDWRFGQLIENIKSFSEKEDLYYMEDNEFEKLIQNFYDTYIK